MPYGDGRLGLGVSLEGFLAGGIGATVKELLETKEERLTILNVPKYEIEWSGVLKEILSAIGLSGAFDSDTADFSKMGAIPSSPLFIGNVIHKTMLKVNEKGTEVAVVTVADMVTGAVMPPEDLVILDFDHPFVCGIADMKTAAPLFLRTVEITVF